jgi:hypothetical protein
MTQWSASCIAENYTKLNRSEIYDISLLLNGDSAEAKNGGAILPLPYTPSWPTTLVLFTFIG